MSSSPTQSNYTVIFHGFSNNEFAATSSNTNVQQSIATQTNENMLNTLETRINCVLIISSADNTSLNQSLDEIVGRYSSTPLILLENALSTDTIARLGKFPNWSILNSDSDLSTLEIAIEQACASASQLQIEPPVSNQPAECIAVIPAIGGAGATLVAVELAYQKAKTSQQESVCLIDLNEHDGKVAAYMNCESNFSEEAQTQTAEKVDRSFFSRIISKHSSGVDVISAPARFSDSLQISDGLWLHILETACRLYNTVILDIPRRPSPLLDQVALGSDAVFIVTDWTVPALNAARQLGWYLQSTDPTTTGKVKTLLNRQNKTIFGAKLSMSQAEEALSGTLFGSLRSDWTAASSAVNLGRPVGQLRPSSPFTKDVLEVIEKLRTHAPVADAKVA